MPESRQLRVFLCHSSNDKPVVRELYHRLHVEGWMDVWLDEEKLYPGQDWNLEIEKAVEDADAILVCLSNNSITKEGYVQREIRIVLDYADYKQEGTLYVIPVRLEDCEPPRSLRRWQYADYFEQDRDSAYKRLLVSLKRRAKSFGISTVIPKEKSDQESKPVSVWAESAWAKTDSNKSKPAGKRTSGGHAIYTFGGIEIVKVPAGKFLMGSSDQDEDASDDEKPQHKVELPYVYYMGRFPITNGEYANYARENWIEHPVSGWEKKQDHPVTEITWDDAMKYCDWLNGLLKGELPAGLVLRLPNEAEWEKVARGEKGLKYPWGDLFDKKKCNFDVGETTPVDYYSPQGESLYGCADMSGNVWEWTNSVYKKYPFQPLNDVREDDNSPRERVLRGGSFSSNQRNVRCASRYGIFKFFPHLNGFRVCASPA